MSLWKRAGCQTESKALEKSIVDRPERKPAWRGERMELDSRKKSRRYRMIQKGLRRRR